MHVVSVGRHNELGEVDISTVEMTAAYESRDPELRGFELSMAACI
jgi:hypothetical protein